MIQAEERQDCAASMVAGRVGGGERVAVVVFIVVVIVRGSGSEDGLGLFCCRGSFCLRGNGMTVMVAEIRMLKF